MSDFNFTNLAYTASLAEKKLVGSRCTRCGQVSLPPRLLCQACNSTEMQPFEFSGRGRLAAFSVIYYGPTFMKEFSYGPKNPYVAGIVDLDEGPRISAQILGLDIEHPESIRIGVPLKAAFIERGENNSKKCILDFRCRF